MVVMGDSSPCNTGGESIPGPVNHRNMFGICFIALLVLIALVATEVLDIKAFLITSLCLIGIIIMGFIGLSIIGVSFIFGGPVAAGMALASFVAAIAVGLKS